MANTNFYLKTPADKKSESFNKETIIYLFISYNGKRLKMSIGESIKPSDWNSISQRAKRTMKGAANFNNHLDEIEAEAKRILREAITKKVLNVGQYVTDGIREYLGKGETTKDRTFSEIITEYLSTKGLQNSKATIIKYGCTLKHLTDFAREKKIRLNFEEINISFLERFSAYLINDKGQLNSSQSKYLKNIKTFLRWANERGYHDNLQFTKFKVKEYQTDIIYLTENELMSLYNLDLTNNLKLAQVRDVLCFECFTGLRFSDVKRLRKENIKNGTISITALKTRDKLNIPLNDYALEILNKYDGELPVISGQRTNEYIKDLGELAKIDEPTQITKYKGSEVITETIEKYKLITTHTGRRTFVTLSLEKGLRPEVIMAITGHKRYDTFKKYIKLTDKVLKVEMNRVWSKSKGAKVVNLQ